MPKGIYKRKPRKPRFKIGQRISKIVLEEYVGRHIVGQANGQDKWDHVFKGLCDCGNYRLCSQRYLSNKKHGPQCEECSQKAIEAGRAKSSRNSAHSSREADNEALKVHSMRW